MTTVIIALWRHRLNLNGFSKPNDVRIVAVAPAQCIVDETCVDVLYQIEGPVNSRDQNHSQLIQKVRELASNYGTTKRRLCVFERELQKAITKIRFDLDIDGTLPEQFEQLIHLKELKLLTRRSGLTTAKHCSMPSPSQPDACVEKVRSHLGGFPIFIKPLVSSTTCMHTRHIARSEEELKSWAKARSMNMNHSVEYFAEESLENGYEFTAVCSKTGLIGTIATVDTHRTLFECVRDQTPYALEYLSVEQTRDILPGIESFVLQIMKSVFSRSIPSIIFVKGFYKGHNNIYFISASLEPRSDTHRRLFHAAHNSVGWEVKLLESIIEPETKTGDRASKSTPGRHYMVVNFPTSAGILLHQTTIPKRSADIRVAWRTSEGEELYDCDTLDENIVQVFLSHSDRSRLLEEVSELITQTDITVDKLCLIDKHNVCRRPQHLHPRQTGSLIRSCTTAD